MQGIGKYVFQKAPKWDPVPTSLTVTKSLARTKPDCTHHLGWGIPGRFTQIPEYMVISSVRSSVCLAVGLSVNFFYATRYLESRYFHQLLINTACHDVCLMFLLTYKDHGRALLIF